MIFVQHQLAASGLIRILQAVNFTPPDAELQKDFNVTYDLSAYGENGPIQLSYPPFQWPGVSKSNPNS